MKFRPEDASLELAQMEEAKPCMKIIEDARAFQQRQGFVQWTPEYPNLKTIQEDIDKQKGYVLKIKGKIAGYMCIDFEGEPVYAGITEGAWHKDAPYAVVHRMAFAGEFRKEGLSQVAFWMIEDVCLEHGVEYIRVDTQKENKLMQHVLKKCGFEYCGIVDFLGPKLAFDRVIEADEE